MKELRTAGKVIRRITSVMLVLSVVGVLAACQKVEADYIIRVSTQGTNSYYSISNDNLEKLSSFQYASALNSQDSEYSPYEYEFSAISIDADGNDPADWKYSDDNGFELDPEQEQFWIEKMTSMDLPYTGTIDVMYYTFDDYLIVYAAKWGRPGGDDDLITNVVFHNDEIIGTIDERGLFDRVYKHN